MNTFYSSEKNIQILIALLKAHGIKKIVTSPGATNMMLNASLMYDGSFEMFSCIDERGAAYMACGMAEESGEPVMIACTGATAARNYYPALTEAYYRKLPILVVTGTQDLRRLGNLYDQVTDRSVQPKDIVTFSAYIPTVRDEKDVEDVTLKINQAISALTLNGGGPAHLNLETIYSTDLTVKELPQVRVVDRIDPDDDMPLLPEGKIAVFIGSHKQFSQKETEAIDSFCANHDAVVFCDHTSGYKGKFRQLDALLVVKKADCLHDIRLLIHLGNVSGDHFSMGPCAREVWRLSDDGLLRDRYGKLTRVFDMSDYRFFSTYAEMQKKPGTSFINQCKREYADVYSSIPELPFSNIWCAKQLSVRLPEHSAIHFGILTSLRSWNFFEIPFTINSACNVGGFGTDGMLSSLLGASFIHPNKLYFGVVGDLAFFYDMNALGNRHLGNNIRILLVNNGKGCEFTHYLNPGHIFKEDVNPYIAAAGHNGNQSETLVRDYAKNLGMDYFSAHSKDDFIHHIDAFVSPKVTKSCIFEVFTRDVDENEALKMITSTGTIDDVKTAIKDNVKNIVGEKGAKILKGLFKKMNTQLSNSIKEVIVAIPIYKEQPSESEIISLRQGLKILRNHEIVIFTYKGLELSIYEQIAEDCDKRFRVEYFSKAYFESVDGYNQLMMRTEFYHRFAEYEYLFIYQLDAFVFKDDLLLWCRRGYDYIGAPWIDLKNGKYRFLAVGNGGFSLRKVSYCQRILQLPRKKCLIKPFYPCTISPPKTFRSKISPYIMAPFRLLGWKNTIQWYIDHINEDGLFSWYIQQSKYSVNLPSCEEAVYFAFELYPQYCYQVTKGVLPFGCHAFMKYEYEVFWKEIIQREYVG